MMMVLSRACNDKCPETAPSKLTGELRVLFCCKLSTWGDPPSEQCLPCTWCVQPKSAGVKRILHHTGLTFPCFWWALHRWTRPLDKGPHQFLQLFALWPPQCWTTQPWCSRCWKMIQIFFIFIFIFNFSRLEGKELNFFPKNCFIPHGMKSLTSQETRSSTEDTQNIMTTNDH